MSVPREMQEYADAAVKAVLIKLQRRWDMMLKNMEDRDAATLAQRQGTPMPPELIDLWTDALWAASCPTLPQEAKDETNRFIDAKFIPRMGLYTKQMIPVDDMIRPYLMDDEVEVMDVPVSKSDDVEEKKEESDVE